jgi:hypothetical protein
MCRFALHRQGENSHVSTRGPAMACRGVTLAPPHRTGLGCRPTETNVSPSTDRWMGSLPAVNGRVPALGEIR